MKLDDIKGKEVIDDKGNSIGEVEDIDLNLRSRRIEGLVLREGGLTGKIGRGETRIIPCDMIDKIGDKILLKEGEYSSQQNLDVRTNR